MITGGPLIFIFLPLLSVFPKPSGKVLQVVGARLSGLNRDSISHAFVQTDSELHYFRDVSNQDVAFIDKRQES